MNLGGHSAASSDTHGESDGETATSSTASEMARLPVEARAAESGSSGTDTESDEDTIDGSSIGGQPGNLTSARLLPDRPFLVGGQQFSMFSRDGTSQCDPLSQRGSGPGAYSGFASPGGPLSSGAPEEGNTMRRVTASLLEILTQVAAVSKEEPHMKGGKGDDFESVTLYEEDSATDSACMDMKGHSHSDDLDPVYQTNMKRLTTTLVDLLGAMNKGKDGKGLLMKGDAALSMEELMMKDPESGMKLLNPGMEIDYKGDNILPFNSEPDDIDRDQEDESIPKHFKKVCRIHWGGAFAATVFLCVFVFYLFFRVRYTMGVGSYLWYAIIVFAVEVIGGIAMIPYAFTLLRVVRFADKLEQDAKGQPVTAVKYHVRVMIPCYREPLDVISKTFLAALSAPCPVGCQKSVYLCDDGKDPEKRAFVRGLGRSDAHYVSGRKREKGEMNGKSANINNIAYLLYPEGVTIPLSEVMCIFDADQVPNPDFFLKTVPLMDAGQDVGMVLSPQTFYNMHPDVDIFNHANVHFWDYTQPGYDAMGLISCTGTNFLVRSRAFLHAGGFPTWTLTEDFALGIELKKRRWQCRYVEEYLAIGEAPEDVRNCFQQRSRWTKGHFQTFFSSHCPMFQRGLSFGMRLMYSSVIVSYLACFTATPVLMAVPCITIWVGVFPIVVNFYAGICVTAYYGATSLLMFYCKSRSHFQAMWFAAVCNSILWFAYLKAAYRATVGKFLTGKIVFKSTLKGLQKLKDSALRDVWMAMLTLTILLTSFIVGCIHISRGPIKSPLIISLLWVIYNAVPQVLLLWYAFITKHGRLFSYICKIAQLVSLLTALAAIVLVWPMIPPTYQYSEPVEMQWYFYQSQMSGVMPKEYMVSWRGDSHTADSEAQVFDTKQYGNWTAYLETLTDGTIANFDNTTIMDLAGGYYTGMAAGLIKHTVPEAFSTAMLAWGLLSFPDKYKRSKSDEHVKQAVRQGTDYLMKLYWIDPADENNTAVVSRVGRVDVETKYWGRPEDEDLPRPAFMVSGADGGADLAGSVAGALAAGAMVFRDTDPSYAAELIKSAETFWKHGNSSRGVYTRTDEDSQYIYNSTTFYDDMAWGAAWLYRATNNQQYLAEMYNNYVRHVRIEGKYDFQFLSDPLNVFWPTNLVMAQTTDFPTFHNQTKAFLKQWICSGSTANYTLYGKAVNPNSPTFGATANAVFISTVYADMIKAKEPTNARVYECWALSQLRYMLGDSGRSYMIGFGKKSPEMSQDRGAACPSAPVPCNAVTGLLSPEPDPHALKGGLVQGPGLSDSMDDVRNQNASRVGIENNVGVTGALIGVLDYPHGLWEICLQNYGVYARNPVCGSYLTL